jgi:hypothetical protein
VLIEQLEREVDQLDQELEPLVAAAAPRTLGLYGVGTQGAAQLLITAGENIDACAARPPSPGSVGQLRSTRAQAGRDATALTSRETARPTALCT